MRIKIKQKPDLIKVGSQSISDIKIIKKIVGTSEVKKISVSFLLGIDVSECLSKNVQTGRFILSENKIDINETILDTPSLNQIINVDSRLKDAIIEKKTGVNFIDETEKIFDITSIVSNDDAKNRATYKSRITKVSTDSTTPVFLATTVTPESLATTRSTPVPTRGAREIMRGTA